MPRPRIAQADGQLGFHWVTPSGQPIDLPGLMAVDDEPERLPATHLEALDDALIDAAGRFGELLGGGRPAVLSTERADLEMLSRVLDRLIHEYAAAIDAAGMSAEIRAGQIVGTAALIGVRARMALGTAGPFPFDGELDDPATGVVAGFGQLQYVDERQRWHGARWVVATESGKRYPLTLSMLLFDSSGVNKDAAITEHSEALAAVTGAATANGSDTRIAAGAVDWLLYDWLMAHRESPESGAIEIRNGRSSDAVMIVAAADAAARCRARSDPAIFAVTASSPADERA